MLSSARYFLDTAELELKKREVEIFNGVLLSINSQKAHSCENVTDPVTFFQKMSYRGYILFRIHFQSKFFKSDWYT